MADARRLAGAALADALRDSRARTWSLVDDLDDAQWAPARRSGVNPIAWELAHLAWFAEFWMLRGPHGRDAQGHATAQRPARFVAPDAHFDSARLAHAARWTTPMPDRATLATWMGDQLDACIDALPRVSEGIGAGAAHGPGPGTGTSAGTNTVIGNGNSTSADADRTSVGNDDDATLYFARLALFHEDMHGEAFCWLRAALGHPAPRGLALPAVPEAQPLARPADTVDLGAGAGFAFDNELPPQPLALAAHEIDSAPLRAGAFARFVEAGGYDQPAFWPAEAGAWRAQSGLAHPQRWRRAAHGGWEQRWFDTWQPLDPAAPLIHVNAFEAEAYCRWAGRRLPSAAEWEYAARSAPRFTWGHSVWEWTADPFAPYPGFTPGPYREYSQPWFGTHRELRGGAFATHARLHDPRYRNFFEPQRTDIFAGFRTAAR